MLNSLANLPDHLIVYKIRKPGIPFYFGRKVFQSNDQDNLIMTTKNLGACYLVTSNVSI